MPKIQLLVTALEKRQKLELADLAVVIRATQGGEAKPFELFVNKLRGGDGG